LLIFGVQYFEFGAQYSLSLPLYEQSQQQNDASHRFTCFRHWRIMLGGKENIACQIQNTARQVSETVRNRTHGHVNFFLRVTDTMTSQNIDLSSLDIIYRHTWMQVLTNPWGYFWLVTRLLSVITDTSVAAVQMV
jgi:hypothetical protein